jgi:hypothetical protein
MKRAALIVLIVILTGFLFERFVFTSRVNKPGVQTEGRGADKIAGTKDAETRKEITARLIKPVVIRCVHTYSGLEKQNHEAGHIPKARLFET